jgi:hypothetical protein
MTASSTSTPHPAAGPYLELSPEERTLLAATTENLRGVAVASFFSEGLLVNGTTDGPLTMTPSLAEAVIGVGEENVGRWKQLHDAAPFVVGLAHRLTDAHIDAAIAAARLQDNADLATLRHRAQAEGGVAAFVQARIQRLATDFAAELNRAIELYRYFVTWPDGYRPDGPAELDLSARDSAGLCAFGVAAVAVGAAEVGFAAGKTVASGGTLAPVGILTAEIGIGTIGAGLAIAAHEC